MLLLKEQILAMLVSVILAMKMYSIIRILLVTRKKYTTAKQRQNTLIQKSEISDENIQYQKC